MADDPNLVSRSYEQAGVGQEIQAHELFAMLRPHIRSFIQFNPQRKLFVNFLEHGFDYLISRANLIDHFVRIDQCICCLESFHFGHNIKLEHRFTAIRPKHILKIKFEAVNFRGVRESIIDLLFERAAHEVIT